MALVQALPMPPRRLVAWMQAIPAASAVTTVMPSMAATVTYVSPHWVSCQRTMMTTVTAERIRAV
jgi:hypothetical protein